MRAKSIESFSIFKSGPNSNFVIQCDYECDPTSKLILDKSEIDTDTYNMNFAQPNIYKVIELIKNLYSKDFIYDLRDIIEYCLHSGENVEEMYVYTALDILLNNDTLLMLSEDHPRNSLENFLKIINNLSETDLHNIKSFDLRNIKKTLLIKND